MLTFMLQELKIRKYKEENVDFPFGCDPKTTQDDSSITKNGTTIDKTVTNKGVNKPTNLSYAHVEETYERLLEETQKHIDFSGFQRNP